MKKRFKIFALSVLALMAFFKFGADGFTYLPLLAPFVITGKNLVELNQRKSDIIDKISELNESVKNGEEIRAFTETEQKEYDSLVSDLESISKAISQRQIIEKNALPPNLGKPGFEGIKPPKEIEKIRRDYSFLKAIRMSLPGEGREGLEKEMHDEGLKDMRGDHINGEHNARAIIIPKMILDPNAGIRDYRLSQQERRDMTAGTDSEGGYAVATVLKDFIGYLYNTLVLGRAGADFMTGLIGNVDFPTEATVSSATWEGETDANAESSPTVGKVSMTPKRLGTYTDISQRLLIQTSPSIEARIRRQLVMAIQQALQEAAIEGSGVSPIPTGILTALTGTYTDNIVAIDTNGGAPTWAKIIEMETIVADNNGDMGRLAYIMNAKGRGTLKSTVKESGQARYLWNDTDLITPVNNTPAFITNSIPQDLTKGTGTDLSAIIYGNWMNLLIGMWGGIEVMADPYTQATNGLLRLVINSFADIALANPEGSFSAIVDMVTT